MSKVNHENGNVLGRISFEDINKANPNIDILSIRRQLFKGIWLNDRYHLNDIEPLPRRYAEAFPMFKAGDLLISVRSLNLIFIMDPDTLKVKWWRVGQTRRQHDPDWQADGTITVFDNNMRDKALERDRDRYSRIWRMDPASFEAKIVYDGQSDNFYTSRRGKHQMFPNGNILITSSEQRRVLEVTPDGETVFEFLNKYDNINNLLVSEAIWVRSDFFKINFKEDSLCN